MNEAPIEHTYSFEEFKTRWPDMFADVVCGFYLPKHWGPVVWAMCGEMEALKLGIKVDQVKSKFGGLRFYFHVDRNPDLPEEEGKLLQELYMNIGDSLVRVAEAGVRLLEKERGYPKENLVFSHRDGKTKP